MALSQIQVLNPTVSLNLDGYNYRAYVKDDVLFLAPPAPKDRSMSIEDKEPGDEEHGGGESLTTEARPIASEAAQSSKVVPSTKAAPSS